MTKRILICEDEPLARETLRDFIAAMPELTLIDEATNGRDALEKIRALKPDIITMDIQMPHMTGLEVVRSLDDLPATIFTTAYDQHAVTAFELNAVDYLLKPFTQERFEMAIRRVLEEASASRDAAETALAERAAPAAALSRILVRDRGRIFPLSLDEIEYLKSDSKYTQIAARGSSFLVRIPISELEGRLDPARFIRVHRGAIINLEFVESMKPDEQSQLEIQMTDGSKLLANRDASKLLRDLAI